MSNIARYIFVPERENGAMKNLTRTASRLEGAAPLEMIISFENASSAIAADQLLSGAGIAAMVMPVPSSIQSGCGFCLRLPPELLGAAIARLESGGIPYTGVFSRAEEHGGSVYAPFKNSIVAGGMSVEE
jgi:hypothetical protein